MKIAVVDDDFTARTLIAEFLEDEGYQVIKGETPEELTPRISEVGVIVMDVMIGQDRTKGLQYVRDNAENITKDKLVIFVSNFGQKHEGIQDLLNEINDKVNFKWFDKTFDTAFFDTLLKYIQETRQ